MTRKIVFQDSSVTRTAESGNGFEVLRDAHLQRGAEVCFIKQIDGDGQIPLPLTRFSTIERRITNHEVGTVLHGVSDGRRVTLWYPRQPREHFFDEHGRPRGAGLGSLQGVWELDEQGLLSIPGNPDRRGSLLLPYVQFDDPHASYFRELSETSEAERRPYRVSDWFSASSLGSIWDYLLHGSLYDPRATRTNGSRFKCQQCAYAWWNYLQHLSSATAKNAYGLLRDEVAYSVLLDMDPNGGWQHGCWSNSMETHARFQLDGIGLFLSQYDLTRQALWLDAGRRGMSFVFENLTDHLDDDLIWFLHDTIESQQRHRISSTIFGKDPGNSLCLNTHLQALKVLWRMHERQPDDPVYLATYAKGMQALKRVLDHQPADVLYRFLMPAILGDRVPMEKRRVARRIRRRLLRPLRRPLYWHVQRAYPRWVQPNGFIERDLSLSCASDRYHITNIKDLLKLYELDRASWLRAYIVNGVAFMREYVGRMGLRHALKRSPYYIEMLDVLLLYSRLIEDVPAREIDTVRDCILSEVGGYSLEGELCAPEG